MNLLLRSTIFLIGALIALLVTAVFSGAYPWFWLPIGTGILIAGVTSVQPWMKPHKVGGSFAGAIGSGTTLTYCASTHPITSRVQAIYVIALVASIGLFFVFECLQLLRKGWPIRSTRPMTGWMLIPILGGLVLGFLSGGLGGANHMHSFMTSVFHITQEQAEVIVRWIRKTIHFVAYGTLAYGFLRVALAGKSPKRVGMLFALTCTLIMASFDELRQTSAPNRSGSVWDVMLDMTGATTFVFLGARAVRNAPSKGSVA